MRPWHRAYTVCWSTQWTVWVQRLFYFFNFLFLFKLFSGQVFSIRTVTAYSAKWLMLLLLSLWLRLVEGRWRSLFTYLQTQLPCPQHWWTSKRHILYLIPSCQQHSLYSLCTQPLPLRQYTVLIISASQSDNVNCVNTALIINCNNQTLLYMSWATYSTRSK